MGNQGIDIREYLYRGPQLWEIIEQYLYNPTRLIHKKYSKNYGDIIKDQKIRRSAHLSKPNKTRKFMASRSRNKKCLFILPKLMKLPLY